MWVGSGTYLTGDPSATTGIATTDGKFRVFAGRRSDPFAFNLSGFRSMVSAYVGAASGFTFDAAGCPALTAASASSLRSSLSAVPSTAQAPCAANQADCFSPYNVRAIVIQVDPALLNTGTNKLLNIWASTHVAN